MAKQQGKHKSEDTCVFCNSSVNDEDTYGKMITMSKIKSHYFCMLFASGLQQNGKDDDEGLLGFMPLDIRKEVKRASRLKCVHCKEKGATIGCGLKSCRKMYHFKCGKENGSLNQFFDCYVSYCEDHRLNQVIPVSEKRLSFHGSSRVNCAICYMPVEAVPCVESMNMPCCKNAWLHRNCIQKQASSAGVYFFKCPLCNNKDHFQREMLNFGIYIPEQDASWEREPNAFQELLQRHCKCDNKKCICPKGRSYNKDGSKWEVVLCDYCGHSGTHIACQPDIDQKTLDWACYSCKDIHGGDLPPVTGVSPDSGRCKIPLQPRLLSPVTSDGPSSSKGDTLTSSSQGNTLKKVKPFSATKEKPKKRSYWYWEEQESESGSDDVNVNSDDQPRRKQKPNDLDELSEATTKPAHELRNLSIDMNFSYTRNSVGRRRSTRGAPCSEAVRQQDQKARNTRQGLIQVATAAIENKCMDSVPDKTVNRVIGMNSEISVKYPTLTTLTSSAVTAMDYEGKIPNVDSSMSPKSRRLLVSGEVSKSLKSPNRPNLSSFNGRSARKIGVGHCKSQTGVRKNATKSVISLGKVNHMFNSDSDPEGPSKNKSRRKIGPGSLGIKFCYDSDSETITKVIRKYRQISERPSGGDHSTWGEVIEDIDQLSGSVGELNAFTGGSLFDFKMDRKRRPTRSPQSRNASEKRIKKYSPVKHGVTGLEDDRPTIEESQLKCRRSSWKPNGTTPRKRKVPGKTLCSRADAEREGVDLYKTMSSVYSQLQINPSTIKKRKELKDLEIDMTPGYRYNVDVLSPVTGSGKNSRVGKARTSAGRHGPTSLTRNTSNSNDVKEKYNFKSTPRKRNADVFTEDSHINSDNSEQINQKYSNSGLTISSDTWGSSTKKKCGLSTCSLCTERKGNNSKVNSMATGINGETGCPTDIKAERLEAKEKDGLLLTKKTITRNPRENVLVLAAMKCYAMVCNENVDELLNEDSLSSSPLKCPQQQATSNQVENVPPASESTGSPFKADLFNNNLLSMHTDDDTSATSDSDTQDNDYSADPIDHGTELRLQPVILSKDASDAESVVEVSSCYTFQAPPTVTTILVDEIVREFIKRASSLEKSSGKSRGSIQYEIRFDLENRNLEISGDKVPLPLLKWLRTCFNTSKDEVCQPSPGRLVFVDLTTDI